MALILIGFGLNFYGFFVFAVLWILGYFSWARRINSREKRQNSSEFPQRRFPK
jgi:hypothetical protein